MAVCTQCGAPIRWVSTQTGRRLALDAQPAPWSTLHSWVLEDTVARLADPRRDHSAVPRYRTHWVTCTRASADTIAPTAPPRVLPARGSVRQVPGRGQR